MRHKEYTAVSWLTSIAVITFVWVAFFVALGLLARAAKELFCLGFGC